MLPPPLPPFPVLEPPLDVPAPAPDVAPAPIPLPSDGWLPPEHAAKKTNDMQRAMEPCMASTRATFRPDASARQSPGYASIRAPCGCKRLHRDAGSCAVPWRTLSISFRASLTSRLIARGCDGLLKEELMRSRSSHTAVLAWSLACGSIASCSDERGYQESCAESDECEEGLECRPVLFGSTIGCNGG